MQVSTIPPEIAAQAAMLNKMAGTLQAWSFLASHGYSGQQIFVLLAGADGPEHRRGQHDSTDFTAPVFP